MFLVQVDPTIWSVPSDAKAEEETDGSQVADVKVLGKDVLDVLSLSRGASDDGDIINEDRDDDLGVLGFPEVDGRISDESLKSILFQYLSQSLIPESSSLLEPVQSLHQQKHSGYFVLISANPLISTKIV